MKISEIIKKAADIRQNGEAIALVTHGGPFHSDDVLATVILELFLNQLRLDYVLTRNSFPKKEGWDDTTPNMIIYDIGLGCYDHHQVGDEANHCKRIDEDGTIRKYAAVGLLWKEIGPYMFPQFYQEIYNDLIKPIDDHDNGNGSNPLSKLIGSFNGYTNTDDCGHDFLIVTHLVKKMVSCYFHDYREKVEDYELITFALSMNDDEYCIKNGVALITDRYHKAATTYCRDNNIPFYVYPSPREGWCFMTIGVTPEDQKKHLVEIPDEVRNWDGVTFLHPTCFLGSAVTRERAIEVVTDICTNQ